MSLISSQAGRNLLPNIFNPGGFLSSRITVRFSRKEREKLKKPEEKSEIILGKVKPSICYNKAGISDKRYPILVKWSRPVRIETCNPSISGDIGGLEHFGKVDLKQPPLELSGSQSLEEAPPDVKKVLSLEYAKRKEVINKLTHDLVKTVQRHPRDFNSHEVKIAMYTVQIRNMQRHLIDLYPYKDQPAKNALTFKIALRRKYIDRLRQQDYKRYEWLLEKLNLFYKPVPTYDKIEVSRKASIERLTDMWCEELKRHRMDGYRRKLEAEQPTYLREKAEKLKFIQAEEKELGLEPTVKDADISACIAKAEELEEKLQEQLEQGEQTDEEKYHIYRESVAKESNIYLSA